MKELGLGIVFVILLCAMAASKGCAAVWPGPDDRIVSAVQSIDPAPPRPSPVRKAAPKAPKTEPRPDVPLTVLQARQASRCQGLNCGHDVRPHVPGHLPWRR